MVEPLNPLSSLDLAPSLAGSYLMHLSDPAIPKDYKTTLTTFVAYVVAAGGCTASNQGVDGVGVFRQKTGVDLEFRNIAPGSSKITVTLNGTDIDVDVDETELTVTIGQVSDWDSYSSSGGTGRVVAIVAIDSPAANAPLLVTRVGGSTPGERQPAYVFEANVDTYLDHRCWLSGYTGGGLTFTVTWEADTATSGNVRLGIAIRRMNIGEDYDDAHVYDFNSVSSAAPNAAGKYQYVTFTFTDGADMDSVADGEMFIARLRREGSHVNDNMSGRLRLIGVVGEES